MIKKAIIVTNNDLLAGGLTPEQHNLLEIKYLNADALTIIKIARDHIHRGHKLLTSPLAGNLRPDQTPVKTVMLTAERGDIDPDNLALIENGILRWNQYLEKTTPIQWDEKTLGDLKTIDTAFMERPLREAGKEFDG